MANRCLILLLPTLNASVDEKKHTDFRPISFLSWQDTAIHFPFRDNSNLFAAETDPAVFRNGAGFPSHGMTVISLIIGGTIVV